MNKSKEELNVLIECETQKLKIFNGIINVINRLEKLKSRFILDFTELRENLKKLEIVIREINIGDNSSGAYSSEILSVDETENINELLENFVRIYGSEAAKYDQMVAMIVEDYFNEIKRILEDVNNSDSDKIIDDYIFETLRQNFEYSKNDICNIYSEQIASAFSLNNSKLLNILETEKGSARKEKIRRFAVDTMIECNSKLIEEISEFVSEQHRFITIRLTEYMEDVREKFEVIQGQTCRRSIE